MLVQLCKVELGSGEVRVGVVAEGHVHLLELGDQVGLHSLSEVLHVNHPAEIIPDLLDPNGPNFPLEEVSLRPPLDRQEVWAAGVTYKRSQEARERESQGAARFYDLVYTASRPELFFKAPPYRVVGPGDRVHVRRDSRWTVPEPELALVLSPRLQIVGYTIGNDMSARDIEGENPLYLPQAKVYDHACALGPVITLPEQMPPLEQVVIGLTIERNGDAVFKGTTRLSQMARSFEDLVRWLGRETTFPQGAILLTGTGIVPPDDFSLAPEDLVHIDITGIGRLTNLVEHRGNP
ncbi:MAG: fumarylacetoacetate hydrolase family protein [Planctomycetes bacterium]|nr:fumarylacetoacetate hydrolase family protein [Planctomycetota bacterium]